jgi:hypothetical protein
MKSIYCLVLLVAGLALAGCGRNENASPPSTPSNPPTPAAPAAPATPPAPATTVQAVSPTPAPAQGGNGYLGTMVKAQQAAVKTVDVTSLNEEIQLFNVQEGRLPKDLNELVTKNYIGQLPAAPAGMKLVYDATQGKVTTAPK